MSNEHTMFGFVGVVFGFVIGMMANQYIIMENGHDAVKEAEAEFERIEQFCYNIHGKNLEKEYVNGWGPTYRECLLFHLDIPSSESTYLARAEYGWERVVVKGIAK